MSSSWNYQFIMELRDHKLPESLGKVMEFVSAACLYVFLAVNIYFLLDNNHLIPTEAPEKLNITHQLRTVRER